MNLFEAREILKKNGYILKRLNECGFGDCSIPAPSHYGSSCGGGGCAGVMTRRMPVNTCGIGGCYLPDEARRSIISNRGGRNTEIGLWYAYNSDKKNWLEYIAKELNVEVQDILDKVPTRTLDIIWDKHMRLSKNDYEGSLLHFKRLCFKRVKQSNKEKYHESIRS